jgi:DNA-directed RNA polymerase subunit RPC12/RpoP
MKNTVPELEAELTRVRKWIDDLQSGMYINCVYCGHRYGPKDKVPTGMADALKLHISQCPEHPKPAKKRAEKKR